MALQRGFATWSRAEELRDQGPKGRGPLRPPARTRGPRRRREPDRLPCGRAEGGGFVGGRTPAARGRVTARGRVAARGRVTGRGTPGAFAPGRGAGVCGRPWLRSAGRARA